MGEVGGEARGEGGAFLRFLVDGVRGKVVEVLGVTGGVRFSVMKLKLVQWELTGLKVGGGQGLGSVVRNSAGMILRRSLSVSMWLLSSPG